MSTCAPEVTTKRREQAHGRDGTDNDFVAFHCAERGISAKRKYAESSLNEISTLIKKCRYRKLCMIVARCA